MNVPELELTEGDINYIINTVDSIEAHESLVHGHRDNYLKLTEEQIDIIINNDKSIYAHNALVWGYINGELKLTELRKFKLSID